MAAIKSELTLGLSLSNENIEVLTRFCESVDFLKSASQSGAEVKLHWPEPAAAPVQVTTPAAVMPPFQQPPVSTPVANPTPAASPSAPNPAYTTGVQPQTAVPTAPSFTPAIPAITPPAPVAPTAAPTYTMDQIAKAGAELAQAGKMPQLLGLLQQFGIQAINMLPQEQYGAFAMALRGLGAQL